MVQKVIKIGSSLGVTIPSNIVKELAVRQGDELEVHFGKKSKDFVRYEKLMEDLERFMNQYGKSLERLAKR